MKGYRRVQARDNTVERARANCLPSRGSAHAGIILAVAIALLILTGDSRAQTPTLSAKVQESLEQIRKHGRLDCGDARDDNGRAIYKCESLSDIGDSRFIWERGQLREFQAKARWANKAYPLAMDDAPALIWLTYHTMPVMQSMPQMPNDAEQGAIVKSLIAITEQTKIGAFKSGPVTIAGWTWLALRARTELLGYTQFSGWRADTQSPSSAGGPQGPPTVNPEPDPGPDPIAPQQQSPSGPSADQATCEKGAGDEAIAACTRQIESRDIGRQVLAAAYRSRGDALGRKGDYDRAIADFTEVIRLDPKSTVAYNRRGLAYDRKGNYVLAIADFTEAIRIDPKNAAAYSNRGVAYSRTGEHGRAVADSNEAVLLQKHTRIFNNRSFVFNNMGSYDSALADLDEAIRLDPKYAFAHKNRGISYEKKGEFEKVTRRSISTPRCRKQSRAHDVFARC